MEELHVPEGQEDDSTLRDMLKYICCQHGNRFSSRQPRPDTENHRTESEATDAVTLAASASIRP